MSLDALTSAEISLPATPDATQVRERIAVLSRHVDLVGLTDNHAGKPRMSPLAAVALAREQGVATVVHVSCRDRNRLALRSQVIGAAALGSEGILCLYGDPVPDVPRVRDYTTTRLLAEARDWAPRRRTGPGCATTPPPGCWPRPGTGPPRPSWPLAVWPTRSGPTSRPSWPCWAARWPPGPTSARPRWCSTRRAWPRSST